MSSNITKSLKERIQNIDTSLNIAEFGRVLEVKDGAVKIMGLTEVKMGEMLSFGKNLYGMVLGLEETLILAVILGDDTKISEGQEVRRTGNLLSVGVGENLLGRVINPIGKAIDGKGNIEFEQTLPMEKIAPGVIKRGPVNTPLQTGIVAIDAMIPIGRGQRELIIGDRFTGKTAIAVDTIINQNRSGDGKDVICIYVAIGQKRSKIAQIIAKLKKYDSMKHTIVVAASASDPASFQFIAPYAGSTIGEYFMDKGKDALIIFDDLTKHAWAYRQMSLTLRRPPGREAYPGDVFYLHSRLLERAAKMSKEHGGGSLTALPIIETQGGDVSAYIPTNVISITDGQIYLDKDLFNSGIRPAIDIGLSVSRVGGAAQIKAMKKVAGRLRLDLAQYRELAAFAQFGSDLDTKTKEQLGRGKRMIEVLKQGLYNPIAVEEQVVRIFLGSEGYLDNTEIDAVKSSISKFIELLKNSYPETLESIRKSKELTEETEKSLREIAKSSFTKGENA